jgi:4-alpha-glucanotransferase
VVLVTASPGRAFLPRNGRAAGRWGVFAPLYALRRADDWGVGDFSSLGRLAEWVAGRRGGVVGTLPLLASFLDRPFEPSPYVPVSRLFWNELFLDVGRLPEFAACPEAQRLTASSDMRQELQALRSAPLVEYARAMALKRRALEALARWFFTSGSPERRAAYERFLGEHEAAEDYARFRAACQRLGAPWTRWPEGPRTGQLQEIDGDPEIVRYHLYVQWACDEQMRAAAQAARCGGVDLYLDLPLGVHPDGYDAWRHREVFAQGCCAGAPPDPVFASGQDWGFPPLHPERLREQRYAYYIACLRHHLRYGGMLRLDHVMSLHRLFWVPRGLGATHGVYVRYRHEQLYAILCLESLRHRAVIVGENLGTVPPQVHRALPRHGIQGMFVVEYELSTSRRRPLRRVPRDVVASLNTHDIPPFAAYWQGHDLGVRVRLGLLSREAARGEADVRQGIRDALVRLLRREGLLTDDATSPADVVRACLAHLGRSRARAVLVNLEDLWLEVQPQNIPGTSAGEPNWRRKLRHDLDALEGVPELLALMRDMARLRGGTAP